MIDPLQTQDDALLSSDPEVAAAAAEAQAGSEQPLDGSSAPVGVEQAQATSPSPQVVTYLDREYIWGPGDRGVDELLVQYDRNRNPWWVLQDDGGDIVALCDRGSSGTGNGRVVAQYTYDAYGAVLTATHLYAHAYLRCGHKGLFVDRLDVGVTGMYGAEPPRLIPYAHTIYQNRNRAYSPQLGRFLQPDPNQSGLLLISEATMNGRGTNAIAAVFELEGHYANGMNSFEYLGSNPWARNDILGLSWDPFDLADELVAERAGNAAALLSQLGQGLKAVAVVAATIASNLPFPMASIAGDLALVALGEQSGEEAAAGVALGIIPGGKLLGRMGAITAKLGRFVGGLASSAWSSARNYAARATGFLANKLQGLASQAMGWLRKSCGCFTADTPVWTLRGLVPIDEIRVGDVVIAVDEASGESSLRRVHRTFVRLSAPIVLVIVSTTSGQAAISTTEEHPFQVQGKGWVATQDLVPGDRLFSASGEAIVQTLAFTDQRSSVYNFEVEGLHTYRVGAEGFLVHNRSRCTPRWAQHLHHTLPKFLGGDEVQRLVAMPPYLHRRFHSDLYAALRNADPAITRGNRRWAAYFADNPDDLVRARTILIDLSEAYDKRFLGQAGGYVQSLHAALLSQLGK